MEIAEVLLCKFVDFVRAVVNTSMTRTQQTKQCPFYILHIVAQAMSPISSHLITDLKRCLKRGCSLVTW